MLDSEDQPPSEISVLLTDTDEIRRLNREFRSIDSATDVLSFPGGSGPEIESKNLLGDIAICMPIADEQASIHKISLESEVACLAVHGGLHLLGYDDADAQGREIMIRKMNQVVQKVGLQTTSDWGSHYTA